MLAVTRQYVTELHKNL